MLPDTTAFSGTGVSGIAIACGKSSVCFVVNHDNLGGFKLGPAGGDTVMQEFSLPSEAPILILKDLC